MIRFGYFTLGLLATLPLVVELPYSPSWVPVEHSVVYTPDIEYTVDRNSISVLSTSGGVFIRGDVMIESKTIGDAYQIRSEYIIECRTGTSALVEQLLHTADGSVDLTAGNVNGPEVVDTDSLLYTALCGSAIRDTVLLAHGE